MLICCYRYSDEVLSKFLAVHAHLADKRFDVKVDDVQFVGYPVSMKHSPTRKLGKDPKNLSSMTINVVFALPVSVTLDFCFWVSEIGKYSIGGTFTGNSYTGCR